MHKIFLPAPLHNLVLGTLLSCWSQDVFNFPLSRQKFGFLRRVVCSHFAPVCYTRRVYLPFICWLLYHIYSRDRVLASTAFSPAHNHLVTSFRIQKILECEVKVETHFIDIIEVLVYLFYSFEDSKMFANGYIFFRNRTEIGNAISIIVHYSGASRDKHTPSVSWQPELGVITIQRCSERRYPALYKIHGNSAILILKWTIQYQCAGYAEWLS